MREKEIGKEESGREFGGIMKEKERGGEKKICMNNERE